VKTIAQQKQVSEARRKFPVPSLRTPIQLHRSKGLPRMPNEEKLQLGHVPSMQLRVFPKSRRLAMLFACSCQLCSWPLGFHGWQIELMLFVASAEDFAVKTP